MKAELDFYDVDNRLLSPAEITLNDITSGDIYRAGGINPEPLRAIFARCL
ncbi:MAG: methenyltetrahydromethanopterin cyclohydrolase [Candidatus Hodarchaeota archaeon]